MALQRVNSGPGILDYLWLLPLGVLGSGFYLSLYLWGVRRPAFVQIAKTRLSQGVLKASLQVGGGVFGAGPIGLILGDIAGRVAGAGTLAALVTAMPRRTRLRPPPIRHMVAIAWRYRSFPLWSTWSTLLNQFSIHLPVLVLSSAYGTDVSGWYGLALLVLLGPTYIVGQSVN